MYVRPQVTRTSNHHQRTCTHPSHTRTNIQVVHFQDSEVKQIMKEENFEVNESKLLR